MKNKIQLFLELANPNENGISNVVSKDDFIGNYDKLKHHNGGDWCRKDGTFCKKYKLAVLRKNKEIRFLWNEVSEKEKEEISNEFKKFIEEKKIEGKGKSIIAYKLCGTLNELGQNGIRKDIIDRLKNLPCKVLGITHNIEIDHKNGRKDDPRVMNLKTQELNDFQPLTKAVNDAKRQHCKKCKETGMRFDAKLLGFSVSFTEGNIEFDSSCKGCYWFDIEDFHKKLIKKEE